MGSRQSERAIELMESGEPLATRPASKSDTFQIFQQRVSDMLPSVAKYLPSMVDPQTLVGVVMLNVRQNPELLECTVDSLIAAALQGLQLNLPPGPFGLSYMVPFNNRVGDGVYRREVQFLVGYKGYIETARRSGEVDSIDVRSVYAGDEFGVTYGADQNSQPRITHIPDMTVDRSDVSNITHVYCVVWPHNSRRPQFDVMSRAEVERVRQSSPSRNSPAWREWWDAMAMAKVVRRLANRGGMPITEALIKVCEADDRVYSSVDADPIMPPPAPQPVAHAEFPPVPAPAPAPKPKPKSKPQADVKPIHWLCPRCTQTGTAVQGTELTWCADCAESGVEIELITATTHDDLRAAASEHGMHGIADDSDDIKTID